MQQLQSNPVQHRPAAPDLSGIPFWWGGWVNPAKGLDCVGLANWAMRAYGQKGMDRRKIQWVYDTYDEAEDAPLDLIDTISAELAQPLSSAKQAEPFDLALIDSNGRTCLGILLPNERLLFMAGGARSMTVDRSQANRRLTIKQWVWPGGLLL